jgi:hypothetical protein
LETSLEKAKQWTQNCLDTHKQCNSFGQSDELLPELPRRVIDVIPLDSDGSVRIIEPAGLRAHYLCLSHCWGKTSLPLETTKQNIQEHSEGIPLDILPKTFQDAVDFVRRLGQRYLWIDSLCIVQDDFDDWRYHAVHMAEIYQNSYLALAATASRNSSEGLYRVNEGYQASPITIKQPKGDSHTVFCRDQIAHWYREGIHGLYSEMDRGLAPTVWPLLDRAWVLQERLLSPRVLHFGHAELLWECYEDFMCECNEGVVESHNYTKLGHGRSLDKQFVAERPEVWRDIVMQFTSLHITKPGDRLPALQGIATQLFRELEPLKVMSGLWQGTILKDMLWSVRHHVSSDKRRWRTAEWRVPSWSWACMDTPVSYSPDPQIVEEHATVDRFHVSQGNMKNATIVEVASMTISAPILPARIMYDPSAYQDTLSLELPGAKHPFCVSGHRLSEAMGFLVPDWQWSDAGLHHVANGTDAYCVLIATIKSPVYFIAEYGVIIRCVDEPSGCYERIGLLNRPCLPIEKVNRRYMDALQSFRTATAYERDVLKELFKGAERKTLTLV